MIDIESKLQSLNLNYEQVTDLIQNPYYFSDEPEYSSYPSDPYYRTTGQVDAILIQSDGKVVIGGDSDYYDSVNDISFSVVKRFNSDGSLDTSFNSVRFTNRNEYIREILQQSSGKLIVIGQYSEADGVNSGGVCRLNTDGSLDTSFNNGGDGFDGNVLCGALLSDGSIICGGQFNNYNGTPISKIAKLSPDGNLDGTFATNINALGLGNNVYTFFVDGSNNIYVGGDFPNRIMKLLPVGTVDSSFNPGTGFSDRVSSISQQSDGKLIVGGWFTQFNGNACNPGIVRLETNGTLDSTFATEGTGLNSPEGIIQVVKVQSDGKILAGGWFNEYNGNSQRYIIRFNSNGTKDSTFNIGTGFDRRVQEIKFLGSTIMVGGFFTQYNGGNLKAEFNFGGGNTFGVARLDSTGTILGTTFTPDLLAFGIDDGGDDMYDGANLHNTNLTQPYVDVQGNDQDDSLCIPITHTPASSGNYEDDYTNPPMNGIVKNGDAYFGTGSKYFTNMYPNLFVLVATDINVEEFSICGNIGSDGSGIDVAEIFPISYSGQNYTCYFKCNYGAGDPSINHLIIVPGSGEGITQLYDDSGSYDDHCIQGISGKNQLFFALYAKDNGEQSSVEEATAVAAKLIEVLHSNDVNEYRLDLFPGPVATEGSEGSLDTSILNGKSQQRDAYIQLNYGDLKNIKILEVRDEEDFDNRLQTLADFPWIKEI